MSPTQQRQGSHNRRLLWSSFCLLLCLGSISIVSAADEKLIFDVFPGYGDARILKEGAYFPVVVEIYNPGTSIDAVLTWQQTDGGRNSVERLPLQLPSRTRKRITLSPFATSSMKGTWEATLRDRAGKVLGRQGPREVPIQPISNHGFLIGSLAGRFTGAPVLPGPGDNRESDGAVARILPEHFPSQPLLLEALDLIYLNSRTALGLEEAQVKALVAWTRLGGHLVLALDQVGDLAGLSWWNELLPAQVQIGSGLAQLELDASFHQWVAYGTSGTEDDYKGVPADAVFREDRLGVFRLQPVERATVLLEQEGFPLIVQGAAGHGRCTLLAFDPERAPVLDWRAKPWFWCRIHGLTGQRVTELVDGRTYSMRTMDSVFGSLVESRQVRKLAVGWLLLLLGIYLVVIGPGDYYLLKRLKKPMWTWVTFPVYVILFSFLVYGIGYLLRAGDVEWNTVTVIDHIGQGEDSLQRGMVFGGLYSPRNASYPVQLDVPWSQFRSEYQGMGGSQVGGSKGLEVRSTGAGVQGSITVPVWTTEVLVGDWIRTRVPSPILMEVTEKGEALSLHLENVGNRNWSVLQLCYRDRVYNLPKVAPGASLDHRILLNNAQGARLEEQIESQKTPFQMAATYRNQAFGGDSWRLSPSINVLVATSFSQGRLDPDSDARYDQMALPPRLDLRHLLKRGDAVLLALTQEVEPGSDPRRFDPLSTSSTTLYRLAVQPTTIPKE